MDFRSQAQSIFGKKSPGQEDSAPDTSVFSLAFICTANICRSAYAHYGFQSLLSSSGSLIRSPISVDSAGLNGLVGYSMDQPMRNHYEQKYQLDAGAHQAKQLTEDFVAAQDLLLVMTEDHRKQLLRYHPSAFHKTFLLTEFIHIAEQLPPGNGSSPEQLRELIDKSHHARSLAGNLVDVDDPYRRSEETYQRVCSEIDRYLNQLVRLLGS